MARLFGYNSIKEHPSKSSRAVNYFVNQNPLVLNVIIEYRVDNVRFLRDQLVL